MKRFNEFINESIRDMMTGPNKDPKDILKDESTTANKKLSSISEYDLGDYFTDEELDELRLDAAYEIINDIEDNIKKGEYEELSTFATMVFPKEEILDILNKGGHDIMEILFIYFHEDYTRHGNKKEEIAYKLLQSLKNNVESLANVLTEIYEI